MAESMVHNPRYIASSAMSLKCLVVGSGMFVCGKLTGGL